MDYRWNEIQYKEDGKILLLYRQERIFAEGLVKKGDRILDIGGWGMLCSRLLQEGADATILDTFGKDQHYSERVLSLPHIKGSILDSALLATLGLFNVICAFEMLEHCQEQELALYNMFLLLKPGGILVGTIPIPGFSHAADDPDTFFLNTKDLKHLLISTGFTIQRLETTPSVKKDNIHSCIYFVALKKENRIKT